MPTPRAFGLEDGAPGLAGTQIGTTSDGRPIVAWPAGISVPEVLDPIEGDPGGDWSGDTDAASGGGDPSPGNGGDSWVSSGPGTITNDDTGLTQQGDQVCSWVQSDDASTVGFWFGLQDDSNSYYVYLAPITGEGAGTIDGFEDGDMAEYEDPQQGSMADWSAQSTTVYDGTYAAACSHGGTYHSAVSNSGLGQYPQAGDTFEYRFRMGRADDDAELHYATGPVDASTNYNYARYQVRVNGDSGEFALYRLSQSNQTNLGKVSVTPNADEWYRVRVQWGPDGTHTVTLYNSDAIEVAQITATDTTYTEGGIGWACGNFGSTNYASTVYFDACEVLSSAGELRLGKYVNGQANHLDTQGVTLNDPTAWHVLKLAWYSDGSLGAAVHGDHESRALATVYAEDSEFASGGVGVEFTEAGQRYDMFQRCGTVETFPHRVDDFEADLYEDQGNSLSSYYSGDLTDFARVTDSPIREGGTALRGTTNNTGISSTSGLPNYPSKGDTFAFWVYNGTDSSGGEMMFGTDSEVREPDNMYRAQLGGSDYDAIALKKASGGTTTTIADGRVDIEVGEWYRLIVEWGDTIKLTLEDEAGNELQTASAVDTDYSSGGIGWGAYPSGDSGPTEVTFDASFTT